jgi:hypothetical protein
MKIITAIISVLLIISCSTDYEGSAPENASPSISISDAGMNVVSSFTRVGWFGIVGNETDMTYHYCVTTDTSITAQTALSSLSAERWISTKKLYADISFPMAAFNSDKMNYIDSVYTAPDSTVIKLRAGLSKIFVYAENSAGTRSPVAGKLFMRMNKKPVIKKLESEVLEFLSVESVKVIEDSRIILPESNPNSIPLDFSWWGTDEDINAKLEFKWVLWENEGSDSVLVDQSGWGDFCKAELCDEIFYNDPEGNYTFTVFVRDDALDPGETGFSVKFSVFTPSFDKGILFINDTDPSLHTSTLSKYYEGNPDGALVTEFYRSLLNTAGYSETSGDLLKKYKMTEFSVQTEIVSFDTTFALIGNDTIITSIDTLTACSYTPSIQELIQYRLLVIASDDRSNEKGVDYNATTENPGYIKFLSQYINAGGKIFIAGHCGLMRKQPYILEINDYKAPSRVIFDASSSTLTSLSDITKSFFHDYFGIYAMTFPETKTWFSQSVWNIGVQGQNVTPADYYLQDNYDFIGVTLYDHIADADIKELKIDSAKVNDCWTNYSTNLGPFNVLMTFQLKDNGSVLTGIPVIEAFKGEGVYKYRSVYDLPRDQGRENVVFEYAGTDTLYHSLKYTDPVLTDGDNSGFITGKTGATATRYIADGDKYRTAFFAFPLYFMANTDGEVNNMFKAMIDWFDLSKDPLITK